MFFSFIKIMKHTEQLQPRKPQIGSNTITVHNKQDEKEKNARKCCGGSNDSGDSKS
jgi:hypothetical protein